MRASPEGPRSGPVSGSVGLLGGGDRRREAGAPPFGRYAAIIVSSEEQAAAAETAGLIGRSAPHEEGMHVYGPAPAPLAYSPASGIVHLALPASRAD